MKKLNLHAHSIYSDGYASMEELVAEYKELDFCSAVITDHVYSVNSPKSLTYVKYTEQLEEADFLEQKYNIPVIVGAEFSYNRQEEVLIFGDKVIKHLLSLRRDDIGRSGEFRFHKSHLDNIQGWAAILAHPHLRSIEEDGFTDFDFLDGYERINSKQDYFKRRDVPDGLLRKKAFCNSDSHALRSLDWCYNLIPDEVLIEDDQSLVNFIKNHQPEHYNG